MNLRDHSTITDRRILLAQELRVSLSHIGTYSPQIEQASHTNCENMIGVVQVPLGVAGPLLLNNSSYYLPLATTEGALVASVNRGCKAITESGGAQTVSTHIGVTRAPVFVVKGIKQAQKFVQWVNQHFQSLQEIAATTSTHLQLLDIKPISIGRSVYLRFRFDTQDAMGMNMATIATSKVTSYISSETGEKLVALSGNLCVDKKANYLNFLEGRGWQISAEVTIPSAIVSSVLKTTPKLLCKVAEYKIHVGSIASGSLGANAQMANILAAIFLATGQDIAHIAECANGITTVEEVDEGVYVSVYLPDVVVGTVGGGTQLPTQQEAISLLSRQSHTRISSQLLAEIIGGGVLAGEISLLASLAENSLATAHTRLGRRNDNK